MTAHIPILPTDAIKHVAGAGLECSYTVLADFAAAGLIKSYALILETIPVGGSPQIVRDGSIPPALWNRIIEEGKTREAMAGVTVRLAGSDLIGGTPSVRLTGIQFAEGSLLKVLARYRATTASALKCLPEVAQPALVNPPSTSVPSPTPLKDAIPPGALTITVAQAIQATGIGRTKINQMMADGILDRRKNGRRTLITVESIMRLLD